MDSRRLWLGENVARRVIDFRFSGCLDSEGHRWQSDRATVDSPVTPAPAAGNGPEGPRGKGRRGGREFWSSAPGLLTGLAAVITAAGTLAGVFYATDKGGGGGGGVSSASAASESLGVVVTYPTRPPEGVVTSARISLAKDGAAVSIVQDRPQRLWVYYTLAVPPNGGQQLSIAWIDPRGRVVGTLGKPTSAVVWGSYGPGHRIAPGIWRSELTSGGLIIKEVELRVGSGVAPINDTHDAPLGHP